MTRACSVVTQLCMHSQSLHTVAALSLALFSLCCLFVCRRGGWRLLPLQPESEWSCRGSSVLNLCRVLIRPDRPPQEVMRLEGARSNHVTSCTRGSGRWDEMWEKNKQKKQQCWSVDDEFAFAVYFLFLFGWLYVAAILGRSEREVLQTLIVSTGFKFWDETKIYILCKFTLPLYYITLPYLLFITAGTEICKNLCWYLYRKVLQKVVFWASLVKLCSFYFLGQMCANLINLFTPKYI